MTADDLHRFVESHFPQAREFGHITRLDDESLEIILTYREAYLRPGGTISGPTLMGLADTAAYFLILSQIGPVALAVTTSLNINFVRKPTPEDIVASARLLKLGKQLAVVDVHMLLAATRVLVAQATVTYSIPPSRAEG
jgi:uncharacterized protein (TIGR00369 family)